MARRRHAQPLGIAHVEATRRLRAAEPLLRRHGVEVEFARVDLDRAGRLRAVDEHGNAAPFANACEVEPPAGRPQHVRGRDQARARRDRCEDARPRRRSVTTTRAPDAYAEPIRPKCSWSVVTISSSPVRSRPESTIAAAPARRLRESDVLRVDVEDGGEPAPRLVTQREDALDPARAAPSVPRLAFELLHHRGRRRRGDRPVRARVEIRVALEHRELRACLLERHPTVALNRRVVGEQPPVDAASLCRPRDRRSRRQSANEDLVDAVRERLGEADEVIGRRAGSRRRKDDRVSALRDRGTRRNCSSATAPPLTWKLPTNAPPSSCTPRRTRCGPTGSRRSCHDRMPARHEHRDRLARDRGAQDAVVEVRDQRPSSALRSRGCAATAPIACMPLHAPDAASAHTGTSWRQTTAGASARHQLDHLRRNARRSGGHGIAVEEIPRTDEQRHARSLRA